jgi:small subunit ribosomal protein S35
MGETHPAAKKVVVQFCPKDLPNLTEAQRTTLIKIAGVRYNPDTDVVKMSCEKFEAPAQNKRYLGDLVNKLIDEAKNGSDSFEDIPLDLRHHNPKRKPQFPEEWKIKPETIQQLAAKREEQKLLAEAVMRSRIVDGQEVVHDYVEGLRVRPMPKQRIV